MLYLILINVLRLYTCDKVFCDSITFFFCIPSATQYLVFNTAYYHPTNVKFLCAACYIVYLYVLTVFFVDICIIL